MLRKVIGTTAPAPSESHAIPPGAISLADHATVMVSSERDGHPIDHICDGGSGPGSTRWVAGEEGDQLVEVVFDTPQTIHRVTVEVEEREVSRTQEMALLISADGGRTYREILRQEFNFSPPGTTFEREDWAITANHATHVRLWIRPDKGGNPCRATLTSLVLR